MLCYLNAKGVIINKQTEKYSTVWHSTVQYSMVQYSMVQYSTIKYGTVQYSVVQYSQYSTVQYRRFKPSPVHPPMSEHPLSGREDADSTNYWCHVLLLPPLTGSLYRTKQSDYMYASASTVLVSSPVM